MFPSQVGERMKEPLCFSYLTSVSGESLTTGRGIQSTVYSASDCVTKPGHWESDTWINVAEIQLLHHDQRTTHLNQAIDAVGSHR